MKSKHLAFSCLAAGFAAAALLVSACAQPATGDGTTTGGAGGDTGGNPTGAGGSATGGSTGSGSGGATSTGAGGSATGAGGAGGARPGGTGGAATGGAGGGTGGAGGSIPNPGTVACTSAPPPAASGGASFPFPQHRLVAGCGYPVGCNDGDVSAAWTRWKALVLVSAGTGMMRVQRPENNNDTVSEGIGYGMVSAVYMNDKPTFDALWAYAQAHFDGNGLMNWNLGSGGNVISAGSATDGDEDMAFGLVMADKQWGGYTTVAKAFIAKIESHELDTDTLKSGDGYTDDTRNPSYFAPAYYRVFAEYTGNTHWSRVIDTSYSILNACADGTSGLVPDWCNSSGGVLRSSGFGYDAARVPFRITQDACWNNESRAKTYLTKVTAFFAGKTISGVVNGFPVKGSGATGTSNSELAFVGPAAVSAMPATSEPLLDQGYARARQLSTITLGYNYYNGSWGLWSLMMMTGNFVNFLHP
jgi:endo-1,4-beta-D-glucanase Y